MVRDHLAQWLPEQLRLQPSCAFDHRERGGPGPAAGPPAVAAHDANASATYELRNMYLYYDICQLDVRNLTDITDFMIIASGSSHRHVHAMADRIREAARKQSFRPIGIEGDSENDWILIDFSDVVVHLMMPEVREFYNLESLWNDHLGRISKTQHDSSSDRK